MCKQQLSNTIRNRRSIRSYSDIHIPEDDLNDILESGLYAPSGKNRQPWRFVIINNSELIKTIAKTTVYSRFVRNAPILVLVFASTSTEYPLEKDMLSIGACLQNIVLTATENGYDSCIIGELMTTNGLELHKHIDSIVNYVTDISISIDSNIKADFEKIRSKNTYEKVEQGIITSIVFMPFYFLSFLFVSRKDFLCFITGFVT